MTTRVTTAKTIQSDFIRRDFEAGDIAQKHTAIWELCVTRWWRDRMEATGMSFQILVYERYRERSVEGPGRKAGRGRGREAGVEGGRCSLNLSQLGIIIAFRLLAHVAVSISSIIFPMEQVELLVDLLGKHP